ncbi:MAG: hypothetical protein M5U28_19950 [Sandaracinaceae bacterium]|nr:hypothetical protein [Sandaracinaceae bacterium]
MMLGCVLALTPSAALAQDEVTQARAAFDSAIEAYEEGRFEDALRGFERAYDLTGAPALLYNIATTHDRLRNDREALEAYERYLEASELTDEERGNIGRRIDVLRRAIERDEQAPTLEEESADEDALDEAEEAPDGPSVEPEPAVEPPEPAGCR